MSDPRKPHFCITPKIHDPGNPIHPVARSVNCYTTNMSQYIDYHLQAVVKQIPSYIKFTNYLINKINGIGNILPNSYLVDMDIKLLYTNTLYLKGIAKNIRQLSAGLDKSNSQWCVLTYSCFILIAR